MVCEVSVTAAVTTSWRIQDLQDESVRLQDGAKLVAMLSRASESGKDRGPFDV